MDDGYLPEYYIRKKQRDRMYTTVWYIVGGVVVAFVAVLAGNFGYRTWGVAWKNRGKPAVNADHADELNELKTEQKIADAMKDQQSQVGDPGPPSEVVGAAPGELSSLDNAAAAAAAAADLSKLDYAESFPLVKVALNAGSGSSASDASKDQASPDDKPKPEETPASTDSTPVRQDDQTSPDKPAEEPAQDKPAPEPKPELTNSVYRIYVAEVSTREAAQVVLNKLGEHGYQGEIVQQEPNFLVKVMQTSKSDEAVAFVNKLKQLGFEPFITRSSRK